MSRSLLALGLAMAAAAPHAAARDLATVDGVGISAEALTHAAAGMGDHGTKVLANPVLRRQLLDHLIESRLLAKAGEAAGADKSPAFRALLEDAKTQILANTYAKEYVAERSGEPQQRAMFAKDPTRFSAKEIRASHILARDEATARRALAEVTAPGADFQKIAAHYASGTDTGTQGGDLGYFHRGRMLPEFDRAAFTLSKGEIYPQPVHSAFGWHIIKVTDVRGDDKVRFEDVQTQVRETLEQATRDSLVAQLKAQAKVVVDDGAVRQMQLGH